MANKKGEAKTAYVVVARQLSTPSDRFFIARPRPGKHTTKSLTLAELFSTRSAAERVAREFQCRDLTAEVRELTIDDS